MFDGEVFGRQIVESVKGYLSRELGPILRRLAAVEARPREESAAILSAEITQLEKRLARVEDRPVLQYLGVFEQGHSYVRGDTVTWAGSIWHCNEPTSDKPGASSSSWTLAVKRGRDAR